MLNKNDCSENCNRCYINDNPIKCPIIRDNFYMEEILLMQKSIYVDANDVKKILAKEFNVPEKNVIKSQYSYTILTDEKEDESNENPKQII